MKSGARYVHGIALAALFTVGNTLIRYPWSDGAANPWIGFLLSVVGALAFACLVYPAFVWLYRGSLCRRPIKRILAISIAVSLGAYSIFCAYRAVADYVTYALEMVLPKGVGWMLAAILLLAAVCLSRVPKKGIEVFSLLCFVGVAACVGILFAFGARHYRWNYFLEALPRTAEGTMASLFDLFKSLFLPMLPLVAYFSLTVPQKGKRILLTGAAIGYTLLFLCVLQTVCTFGIGYAAETPYPYSYAVRVISIGPYFFRLEGLSYFVQYITCLMRVALCLALTVRLGGRLFPRVGKFISPIFAGLIFAAFLFF